MKSTGLLRNFLMYCADTENFPLLLNLLDNGDPNLEPYCRMLCCLAKKLNAVARAYKFNNFPIGDSTQLKNIYSATCYWLNCCINKAEYMLKVLSGDFNQYLLHHQMTRLMMRVNEKIEKLFNLTIWCEKWPKLLPIRK